MTTTTVRVRRKWRPPLSLVVALMLAAVLALPLMGVFFFRIYENQLVRQTEAELIGQAAVLAAEFRREAAFIPNLPLGAEAPPEPDDEPFRPIAPLLDLTASDLHPTRPVARPAEPAAPAFQALGARLAPDLAETQRVTLAGFRILDSNGVVIAGRDELGLSLAGVEEVADALAGHFRAVIRLRVPQREPPPLYSVSRGTSVRVFTAMPVILRGHVAGVIYASRTPSNVMKNLYEERHKVALATLSMVVLTVLIGIAFHRTITGPIRELLGRTRSIAAGDRTAIRPLRHHGTTELATLTQGFLDMAGSLAARSDFIATFAAHVSHELKSPLTSIQGAAELLLEDMDADSRRHFLGNILSDTARLTAIVNRLRDLARAEAAPTSGRTSIGALTAGLTAAFPRLTIRMTGETNRDVAIATDNLRVVLDHLLDNAAHHGATEAVLSARTPGDLLELTVSDNGTGVSPNNRVRIFEGFFTTRREAGGTGMGLPIVRAMLRAHGGDIELMDSDTGAAFRLTIPLA